MRSARPLSSGKRSAMAAAGVRPGHRALALAVCALAVMAAAACGSDDTTGSATPASSTAAPSQSGTPEAGKDLITIKGFAFQTPDSVPAGATVTVKNDDDATHTVTADGKGDFAVEVEGRSSATFTAPDQPGNYAFHCRFHPTMQGALTVA